MRKLVTLLVDFYLLIKIMRKFIAIITVLSITIFVIYKLQNKAKESYDFFYKTEINGIIESIRYGVRSEAYVTINNREYSLFLFNIIKVDGLEKGDSIYKRKKSKLLELHSRTSAGSYIYIKEFKLK
jgi:hypothetical protein